jgi:hypothetical protein
MWLVLFIPWVCCVYEAEPVQEFEFDQRETCVAEAQKRNTTMDIVNQMTWGRFSCVHQTAPIMRSTVRYHQSWK